MTNINIIKMSSKGQIVIPLDMRKGIKEGEKLFIIQNEGKLIIKKASKSNENFQEDLEFARRTEKAWKQIEEGKCKTYTLEEFKKRLING